MYTSVLLLALANPFAPPPSANEPAWLTDYSSARKVAKEDQKPLAVFLGTGERGWQQLSRGGQLEKEAKTLLADNYVCVYVDAESDYGKRLASAFDITKRVGIVISDRGGDLQAFRHAGDLSRDDLVRYLTKYSDPEHVVRHTESNPEERRSYYQPVESPVRFSGFIGGGRSC